MDRYKDHTKGRYYKKNAKEMYCSYERDVILPYKESIIV